MSKYYDIQVLALDLDGTLTDSQKKITPRVKTALEKAAGKGINIVLASGRPLVGIKHVAADINLRELGGYILSNNGSLIVDWKTESIILEKTVPLSVVKEVCRVAHELGLSTLVYDESRLYCENPKDVYVEKERFNNSAEIEKVDNIVEKITWEPNKIMVVGAPEKLEPTKAILEKKLCDRADVFLSEPCFLEITPCGIKKDTSLAMLCSYLGFDTSQLMACGDGFNDIPMLNCAGIAVAMGNAYPETKLHADWIAPTNDEDGVACAIEKYILNKERRIDEI